MDMMELMKQRHSVRQFTDKALDTEAFQAGRPTYGQFKGCRNYLAIVGPKGKAQGTENAGEKRYLVVALGYGENSGADHKMKSVTDISDYKEGDPKWYKNGLEAALLAPTAMNQQKFRFERNGEKVTAKVAGMGFYTKIDLGIVKYHFEIGAGQGKEVWG